MRKKFILETIGYVAAGAMFFFYLFILIFGFLQAIDDLNKPFCGFAASLNDGYRGVVGQNTLNHWTGYKEHMAFPNMITEIDGVSIQKRNGVEYARSKPLGTPIKYTIYAGPFEGTRTVEIPTMEYKMQDLLLGSGFLLLSGLVWMLSAAVVFFLRPNTSFGWGVFVLCMHAGLISAFICNGVGAHADTLRNQAMHYILEGWDLSGIFPACLLFIFTLYEEPVFFRRNPFRYLLLYVPSLLITLGQRGLFGPNIAYLFWSQIPLVMFAFAAIYVIGKTIRVRYFSQEPVYRQRARLFLFTLSVSYSAAILISILVLSGQPLSISYVMLFTIPLPLSLVYGGISSNLFGVDDVVKKTVQYGSALAVMSLTFGGLYLAASQLLGKIPLYGTHLYYLGVIIVFIVLFNIIKYPILQILENIFFIRKIDFSKVVKHVRERLSVALNTTQITDTVEKIILDILQLSNATVLLKDKDQYVSAKNKITLRGEDELAILLEREKKLISCNNLINDEKFSRKRKKYMARMAQLEAIFIIPIIFRNEMLGILALGGKKSGDITFNLTDIGIIRLISIQAATALENARMYREMEEAKEELKKLNAALEYRVTQRTGDLQAKIEALNIANYELAAATRHKSEFLASMSHELRTPLSGIIMYTELVLAGIYEEVNEEVKEILRDMHYNGMALLQLINNILDFSKLEAKKLPVRKEEFSPREAVDQVVVKEVSEAKKKNLKLIGEFEKGLPLGIGDPKRVAQVIDNLISNAIKFSKAGKVVIRIKWKNKKRVLIQVQDTGIGIPKERLENIFNEFEQLESPLIKEYKGVGLGLALCKRLVELMGGEMEVESEVGKGSRFGILIPIKEEAGYEAREHVGVDVVEYNKLYEGKEEVDVAIEEIRRRRAESKKGMGRRILSIEDNPSNQKVISDMLIGMGYQVIEAKNGMEGLEKLRSENPDLVITDLQMPGIDGVTLIKTIRREKQRDIRGIPIVISSASAMMGDMEKGLAAGADAYLTKPFKFDEMINVVRKCLGEEEK